MPTMKIKHTDDVSEYDGIKQINFLPDANVEQAHKRRAKSCDQCWNKNTGRIS